MGISSNTTIYQDEGMKVESKSSFPKGMTFSNIRFEN
jgi:hypothetical protein